MCVKYVPGHWPGSLPGGSPGIGHGGTWIPPAEFPIWHLQRREKEAIFVRKMPGGGLLGAQGSYGTVGMQLLGWWAGAEVLHGFVGVRRKAEWRLIP